MKKSIFQIIIIFILLLGMNGIVLVTYQENNIDDFDYLPQKNNNTYDLNFELNNYNVFEIEEKSFPYFYKIEETTTYFDEKNRYLIIITIYHL